ncbi:hypothetical protein [Bradyrhizobium genosp. P]|uniref:hypothetical protein n=1 Tax=Bradyrhizobium genosp. P TaxID=83641 RepID=UPI003CEB0356
MTNLRTLSTGLIVVAMLATPALAREGHFAARHSALKANAAASAPSTDLYGTTCVSAPRVGAFATAPWTGNNVPCEPGTASF